MIKLRIDNIRNAAAIVLLFVAVCAPLGVVWVTKPELPAEENIGQWVWFGKSMLLSAICVVAACLLQFMGKESRKNALCFPQFAVCVSWALLFGGLVEAVWGLRQLYGFSVSGHSRYALTGSFFNPGPYAGYLAMVLPICLHLYWHVRDGKTIFRKMEYAVVVVAGFLILCVLPATMSRSAWMAAAISCAWVAYMHRDKEKWRTLWQRYKKRYLLWGTGALFVVILGGAGAFILKPDSALGRLFMWKMTCRAVTNYPLGCDKGFAFAYGEAQEAYFAQGDYAEWEERVAGSPEYVFNEYLSLALSEGIVVCVVVLVVIGVCLRMGIRRGCYGICGAILSLLVFSFSSYPMHFPAFVVAGACLLLACGGGDVAGKPLVLCICLILWSGGFIDRWRQEEDACWKWVSARMLYRSGAYKAANKAYEELYPQLGKKGTLLFEYGHSLHKSGLYTESNAYLDKALLYCSDPMILNIMGKNYQELQDYKQAEECFFSSVHRLPGRIYPYYLLAKLYAEPEYRNKEKFDKMKQMVLTKEPKVFSTAIREMREEVRRIADEWYNQ